MDIKDYYKILEIAPSATMQEIKKAFRKLALQYHPDKNNNEPYGTARFAEIKEAYEVLTDPAKKEYYLQQRWYNQSTGYRRTQDIITPVNLLKQVLELERYVSRLDQFRMDKEGLKQYILDLVSDDAVGQLQSFNEPGIRQQIISLIIKASRHLDLVQSQAIAAQLVKLAGEDELSSGEIASFVRLHKRISVGEKYKVVLVIIIALLACLLIYLVSH
jgi:molecular chaperone DnaJ